MNNTIRKLLLMVLVSFAVYWINEIAFSSQPNVAFVDTNKLVIGFSEAADVAKVFEQEKKEYDGNLKKLTDTLKVQMDLMSKKFNTASADEKTKLKKDLEVLNENLTRYQQNGMAEISKRQQQRMAAVLQKVNGYVAEYAKSKRIDLVLGSTADGNILYGSEKRFNITDKLIKGLNERYR